MKVKVKKKEQIINRLYLSTGLLNNLWPSLISHIQVARQASTILKY